MLAVKSRVYTMISTDAGLLALIDVNSISNFFPNVLPSTPYIVFKEDNQAEKGDLFFDDKSIGAETTILFHVYTDISVSTTDLTNQLDRIMKADFFTIDFSSDLPDPQVKYNCRVIRYKRKLLAVEL